MSSSACTNYFHLKVKNQHAICKSIVVYDALHKRKVYLDCFAEGLEVFRIHSAICIFPEMFEELFVAAEECSTSNVLSAMKYPVELKPEEERVGRYLRLTIEQLDERGMKVSAITPVYGIPIKQLTSVL